MWFLLLGLLCYAMSEYLDSAEHELATPASRWFQRCVGTLNWTAAVLCGVAGLMGFLLKTAAQ